jgi:hypothetical protein
VVVEQSLLGGFPALRPCPRSDHPRHDSADLEAVHLLLLTGLHAGLAQLSTRSPAISSWMKTALAIRTTDQRHPRPEPESMSGPVFPWMVDAPGKVETRVRFPGSSAGFRCHGARLVVPPM